MKQAQQMQEKIQKQMAELSVEGSAGGGMVTVRMSGLKQVLGVKIESEAVSSGDIEMLQDLVVAAFSEASRKVDEAMAGQIGGLTGGLGIPGLMQNAYVAFNEFINFYVKPVLIFLKYLFEDVGVVVSYNPPLMD